MSSIIDNLNKTFNSHIRLGIMSILSVNDSVDFRSMRDMLELTDGNLASHLRTLEGGGYIVVNKKFVGRKPNTSYAITDEGRSAFKVHLNALEKLIG